MYHNIHAQLHHLLDEKMLQELNLSTHQSHLTQSHQKHSTLIFKKKTKLLEMCLRERDPENHKADLDTFPNVDLPPHYILQCQGILKINCMKLHFEFRSSDVTLTPRPDVTRSVDFYHNSNAPRPRFRDYERNVCGWINLSRRICTHICQSWPRFWAKCKRSRINLKWAQQNNNKFFVCKKKPEKSISFDVSEVCITFILLSIFQILFKKMR